VCEVLYNFITVLLSPRFFGSLSSRSFAKSVGNNGHQFQAHPGNHWYNLSPLPPRQFLDSRLQLSILKDIIIEESLVQQLMINVPTTPVWDSEDEIGT
jgi:hypothetical protein